MSFLDYVEEAWESIFCFKPFGNHFLTHTASMCYDISDENGEILLKNVYRLENLVTGINEIFEEFSIEKVVRPVRSNTGKPRKKFLVRDYGLKEDSKSV